MDMWIPVNFVIAAVAAWTNFRHMRRGNPRYGLRMAGFVLSSYVAIIYLCATVGLISKFDVPVWMRWFQCVLMFYFIVEARNG